MFPREVIPAGPVLLREPAEADAEAIVRGCSDPEIARFIPAVPVPYTLDDAISYLKAAEQDWQRGGASFAVADPGTGEWLGNIGLKPPNPRGGVEIGYLIAPWARGRGAATAATAALTAWAFAHGVHRVELLAVVENLASQRVAMAAGFHREGVQREGTPARDGLHHDLVSFARLSTDSGERVRPFLPPLPGGSLSDGVVRLTPLEAGDAADYHTLQNLPDVVRYSVPPEAPTARESERFCREAGMLWLAGARAEMAIRSADDDAFAGHIQLSNVIPPLRQAMVGYSLLPRARGRGLATRAVNLVTEWAFGHTSLARVVAGTSPANTASHRVLERAGFTRDALLHGALPGHGETRLDDLQWYRLRPSG
ncbi:GNAT family N-acetyltransferase [Planobispora siamensis]|uniref:GNAT family N-acetyltransferase n=1 Tax=Planobispora siamensis TaxID=936338 RepID=UPI00194F46A3|nr:GNAT family N-acetyltransferase [Planobispora siamensis]